MTSPAKALPVYAKLSLLIIGTLAFFYILYIGQGILIPLLFSFILAILLNPVVIFLCDKKINRIVAILIALIAATLLLAALIYFIGSQIMMFSDSFPQFKEKFSSLFNDIINWISHTFNISKSKINSWIDKTKGDGMQNGAAIIGQTVGTITGIVIFIFLLPVYVFLILFYKPLLLEFIAKLFPRHEHAVVAEVLVETKMLIQNYLLGLIAEAILVAGLNSIGLLTVGLEYAILIAIIGALLNVIPYIGGLTAIALAMLMAIATKSPVDAVWVFISFIAVQFIDNNFIVPRIVASKVKINALMAIIVVFIGGALWGVAGMFLSIPITAIIKVICDRIEPLTPFGFLLGDNQPDIRKTIFKFKSPSEKKTIVKVKAAG